jgi:hypothetical protein
MVWLRLRVLTLSYVLYFLEECGAYGAKGTDTRKLTQYAKEPRWSIFGRESRVMMETIDWD